VNELARTGVSGPDTDAKKTPAMLDDRVSGFI